MLKITPYNKSSLNTPSFGIIGGKGITRKKERTQSLEDKIERADEKLSLVEKITEQFNDVTSIKSNLFQSQYDIASDFYKKNNYDYSEAKTAIEKEYWFTKNKIRQLNKISAETENKAQNEQEALLNKKSQAAEEALEMSKKIQQELTPEKPESVIKKVYNITEVDKIEAAFDKDYKGFDKIAGYKDSIELWQANVIDQIQREEKGEDVNVVGSILFFGPTQNGKTTFAKAFAEAAGITPIVLKCIGRPEARVENFLQSLDEIIKTTNESFPKDHKRNIIIVNEFDTMFKRDLSAEDKSKISNKIYELSNSHCTLFATTNYPMPILSRLDDDNIFSIKVGIEPPSVDDKIAVLQHYIEPRTKEKIDYGYLGNMLEAQKKDGDYSIRQIRAICYNAHKNNPNGLTTEILEKEIYKTKPALTHEMITCFNADVDQLIPKEQL